MSDQYKGIEPMVLKSRISVPYSWWAGETASKFLISLRDEKKILGLKCSKCNKVYIPPKKTCPTCFTDNSEWKELSGEGTLVTFTVIRKQLAALPKDVKLPVICGLIKLDGADNAILHYLDGVKPEDVKIGMRLKAHFADQRKAHIRDIACFKPLK